MSQEQPRTLSARTTAIAMAYEDGLTYRQLSSRFSISLSTVADHIHRAGLQGRPVGPARSIPDEVIPELARRYRGREPLRQLAADYNVSQRTILNTLHRHSIPLNHPQRGKRVKR